MTHDPYFTACLLNRPAVSALILCGQHSIGLILSCSSILHCPSIHADSLPSTPASVCVQIVGVGAVQLSQAMFILNPGTVVPVTVDLYRPEKAGMAKFVGGGVAGSAKGIGKAGLSGLARQHLT